VYLERGTPSVTVRSAAARRLVVREGDKVEVGQPLTDGTPALDDLLCLHGIDWMRQHLLGELRRVYRTVDDRHFEVIVALMLSRVEVLSAGDTELLPGALVDRDVVEEANRRLEGLVRIINGGESSSSPSLLMTRQDFDQQCETLRSLALAAPTTAPPRPAQARPVLLGVRQLALLAGSFLSAASFQQAGKVLTEAALAGRVDPLEGLKENVILGRLIPAGSGFRN
jgi:DNA-directed RNA polymerase subunit beta'